jgi:hypothetical protein
VATTAYELLLDGAPAGEDLYGALSTIEVEENVDLPGAIRLHLPVDRTDAGDLTFVGDARLGPFAALAVVTRVEGGGAAAPECVFDGLVLAHKLHLDAGTANATLEVYGQDATWRMNLEEKTREWVDVTDAAVAETIFGDYGITSHPDNASDDSPSHTEANHSLMQRGTDIQFLRNLARRNGKLCRVVCADQPGRWTGVFARPRLDGEPVAVLALNDPGGGTVDALDFSWDVARPSAVRTWQLLFNGAGAATGASGDADDPGLATLDARGLPDFAGRTMTVLLTAPVGDAGELDAAGAVAAARGGLVRPL